MLKTLIIDGEQKSRESLKILLEDFCNVKVIGLFDSIDSAIRLISTEKPDVVFIDVQMNNELGFDLLSQVSSKFELVYTTSHQDPEFNTEFLAGDYLIKPINSDQLKSIIVNIENKLKGSTLKNKFKFIMQNMKYDTLDNFKLVLPSFDGLLFINYKDIIYCEADSNYTFFYMRDGSKHIVSKTLKEYEALLSEYNFMRIHNSYMINLREVMRYIKGDGGYVVMSNEQSLDVSKRKKDIFLSKVAGVKMI